MISKDVGELLLYLHDSAEFCETCGVVRNKAGKILSEFSKALEWSEMRTARTIGTAENWGMIRGIWENPSGEGWSRRYYIAGKGTIDYIKAIKKLQSSTGSAIDG